jgi:hypothetical protein
VSRQFDSSGQKRVMNAKSQNCWQRIGRGTYTQLLGNPAILQIRCQHSAHSFPFFVAKPRYVR